MKESKPGKQKFVCQIFLQCDFLSLGPTPGRGAGRWQGRAGRELELGQLLQLVAQPGPAQQVAQEVACSRSLDPQRPSVCLVRGWGKTLQCSQA